MRTPPACGNAAQPQHFLIPQRISGLRQIKRRRFAFPVYMFDKSCLDPVFDQRYRLLPLLSAEEIYRRQPLVAEVFVVIKEQRHCARLATGLYCVI